MAGGGRHSHVTRWPMFSLPYCLLPAHVWQSQGTDCGAPLTGGRSFKACSRAVVTSAAAACRAQVEEFASWLTGKVKEQEGKAPHEDPAFASEDVHSWLERVKKVGDCGLSLWQGRTCFGVGLWVIRCCWGLARPIRFRPGCPQHASLQPLLQGEGETTRLFQHKTVSHCCMALPAGFQQAEQQEEAQASFAPSDTCE